MYTKVRTAKINVKVLAVLVLVVVSLGVSLLTARQVRRTIRAKNALRDADAACDAQDWSTAFAQYKLYLGMHPDDLEILERFARAGLAIRPVKPGAVRASSWAYRRIVQLSPGHGEAYEKLAMIYRNLGQYEELAYVAGLKLKMDPNSLEAPLWLADAQLAMLKYKEARDTLTSFVEALADLPERHEAFVQACVRLSRIETLDMSRGRAVDALDWLDKAVAYSPGRPFTEALLERARFYRVTQGLPRPVEGDALDQTGRDLTREERMGLARRDLEAVVYRAPENPRLILYLGTEWLAHDLYDRAVAQLDAAKSVSLEVVSEHYFNPLGWKVALFLLEAELAVKVGTSEECSALADDVPQTPPGSGYRIELLPFVVRLHIKAQEIGKARQCLTQYGESLTVEQRAGALREELTYMEAMVATAEQRHYAVINLLKPQVVGDTLHPMNLRLLAGAYSQTDQTRLAVTALMRYIRRVPSDREAIRHLAGLYLRLRDWGGALSTAELAEPLDPTDVAVKLLRIEASVYMASEADKEIASTTLDEVSAELSRLRAEHHGRVEIRILQSVIAMQRSQPQEAERELKLAIEQCDESLRAEMQLLRFYSMAKRLPEAMEIGRTACDRHAELAEPWIALADLHVAAGDHEAARDCLKMGQQATSDRWQRRSLTLRHALLELVQGTDQAAGIELLQGLADADPQEIYARTLLLRVAEVRSDAERSGELVEQIRGAEGLSGLQWRLYKAWLRLVAADWRVHQQEISDLLQYCIDSSPQWSAPVLLLADMYERLGDAERVEQICTQALNRSPASTDVADRLIGLFEKQGRYLDAERVLRTTQADPRAASALQVRIALGAGEFSRAIEELKLRVRNEPEDVEGRILLARLIYWQTGDRDQALLYLDQAQAIQPNVLAAVAARCSILSAEGQVAEARKMMDDYVAGIDTVKAYMTRASLLAATGDLQRAVEDYRRITRFERPQDRVVGYILLSRLHAANIERDLAIEALDEGLAAFAEDSKFRPVLQRRLLGLLWEQTGPQMRQRGLDLLAELETQFDTDPELMKFRAVHLLETGTDASMEAARAKLEQVTKLQPGAVDAHLTLVSIAMRSGDYEAARQYAIKAIGANPRHSSLPLARARAELALGNTPMALELAELTLQTDPNSGEALYLFASAALQSGVLARVREAALRIEAKLREHPEDDQLLFVWAKVQTALNAPQKAIPALEAYCQATEVGSVTALLTLADLYRLTGDLVRCGQQIEAAEKLDPDDLAVIHGRFLWLIAGKRHDELVGIGARYAAVERPSLETLKTAITVMLLSGSTQLEQEAVELSEDLVSLFPGSADARQVQASCLYQVGQKVRAKAAYQAMLDDYPEDIRVLNDLAWILQEQDQAYDTALVLAEKGLKLSPGDLNLLDTQGTILSRMPDRLADARAVFQRLVTLSPDQSNRRATSLLKLSRTCVELDDPVQAGRTARRAADIDRQISVFTEAERSELQQIILRSGPGGQG